MRTCTICSHKKRSQIEAAIAAGDSLRHIASQFTVGYKAVERHKENCIKPAVQEAIHEQKVQTAVRVLDRVLRDLALIEEALALVWSAKAKDLDLLLKVLPESRQQNKLYAELTGELDQRAQINIQQTPDWQQLRAAMQAALADLPDAKARVLRVLEAG